MTKSPSDPPGPCHEAVVLKPVVRVGLTIVCGDVRQRLEAPRVGSRPYPGPKCQGPK
jgi:hypothetical protein